MNSTPNKIVEPKSFSYVILGDPTPLSRLKFGNRRVWDTIKAFEFNFVNEITDFVESPLRGTLYLTIDFYLPLPKKVAEAKILSFCNTPHREKPDLHDLVYGFERLATGILFEPMIIASTMSTKKYDTKLRTEIKIIQTVSINSQLGL